MKPRLKGLILSLPLVGCHLLSGVTDYRYEDRGGGNPGDGGAGADLPNGSPRGSADRCASAFCSDGVCCDRACDFVCEACRADLTGEPDGSCAAVATGTDPQSECAETSCLDTDLCCGDALAPPGGTGPAACTGGCDATDVCTIICGNKQCDGETLTCPPGFDCLVSCAGNEACEGALVVCAEDRRCNVACSGTQPACDDLHVMCSSGPCQLTCADGACDSTTQLTCGANACAVDASGPSAPTVQCGDSCDCPDG